MNAPVVVCDETRCLPLSDTLHDFGFGHLPVGTGFAAAQNAVDKSGMRVTSGCALTDHVSTAVVWHACILDHWPTRHKGYTA